MERSVRRPVVVVEDHLYHIDRLLELLRQCAPELLERIAVVCLDRPGPDTTAAVERWASEFPQVIVMADAPPADTRRQRRLPSGVLDSSNGYARTVTELLAPRGLLVQDIQLETLRFVPVDQWWETIYLANTVRGMYAERPPQCVFLSNKRGFHATFGKDLLEVGFDPRDVLHKDELSEALVPLLRRRLRDAFPLELQVAGEAGPEWITADPVEVELLSERLDLVLWEDRATKVVLTGRAIASSRGRVELSGGVHEAKTWRALVQAAIDGTGGVSTRALGQRMAPPRALAAECSNAAARHIYSLRRRLRVPDGLLTIEREYRLDQQLAVGRVGPRARPMGSGGPLSTS
ncbi:MAG: hypothetical protein K0V04_43875 [Deltaproteobacteria bacterium]|nr:hypothetical protein [Deltaproteobacteria bacterium]